MKDNNLTPEALMRRALLLATSGFGRVSPNPMVGAVIEARGRIIGEGYHRHFGGLHAEPNAIRSVAEADRHLLREATMYVTLEPCAHYGKTPPCSRLIVQTGIPRVRVATLDPFPEVAGRGVEIMRQAGVEVEVGLLGRESRVLNRRFMTAHTLRRPYVQLKWACTADGFIASGDGTPISVSTPMSRVWMHRERAAADAILVGVDTVIHDNPHLGCRLWPTRDSAERPLRASFSSLRLPSDSRLLSLPHVLKRPEETLGQFLFRLYDTHKVNSLLVEGGRATLQAFLDAGLVDEIRIEVSTERLGTGISVPAIPREVSEALPLVRSEKCGENILLSFFNENM